MKSELVRNLENLEDVRRRAARRTLLLSTIVLIVGSASAVAYVWNTHRRAEVTQERLQEVTEEKDRVSEELTEKVKEETKKREESEKRIDETLRSIKDPARAGIRAYHQGRYDEAVKAYDLRLREDPNDYYIWNLKGYSLFKAGRYNESLAALRKSVEINPKYAWGYFDIARVYCKLNNREEAATAAQKAIGLRGDMKSIMTNDKEFTRLCGTLLDQLQNEK